MVGFYKAEVFCTFCLHEKFWYFHCVLLSVSIRVNISPFHNDLMTISSIYFLIHIIQADSDHIDHLDIHDNSDTDHPSALVAKVVQNNNLPKQIV